LVCSTCGHKTTEQSKFCPHCGNRIKADVSSAQIQAQKLFMIGDYEGALDQYLMMPAEISQKPEILREMGHGYLHVRDWGKAADFYCQALEGGAEYSDVYFNLGLIFMQRSDLVQAADYFTMALKKAERDFKSGKYYLGLFYPKKEYYQADIHLYRGMTQRTNNQLEDAIEDFQQAIMLNGDLLMAYQTLGDTFLNTHEYLQAVGVYEKLLEKAPGSFDTISARNNLGIAYYHLKKPKQSMEQFNEILRREPGNSNAVYNLALVYSREGIAGNVKDAYREFMSSAESASFIFDLSKPKSTGYPSDTAIITSGMDSFNVPRIIGSSAVMRSVLRRARLAAASSSTVMITGENGTGKELLARIIHQNSPHGTHPFIVVNCAAIPENLLESEFFGHERGSFTGAVARRLGRFELAHKGTIFLDEIAELTTALQVKLLRVIQEKSFERVGGNETIKIDVRIIAATNRNLAQLISENLFREDLFYRLNVLPIHIPPLRDRREDIPYLIEYFLRKHDKQAAITLTSSASQFLIEQEWPGNVRELDNFIQRIVVMATTNVISAEDIMMIDAGARVHDYNPTMESPLSESVNPPVTQDTERIQEPETDRSPIRVGRLISLDELEKHYILHVLEQTTWNISRAAQILGLNRNTLYDKIKKYQLTKPANYTKLY
jgi:transcriptional regulator with PAS, ATPase and Fis domain